MAIHTQEIRSESHAEIGALVQQDAGIIIERWIQRATAEQPDAARVHQDVLRDHLPTFLHEMGRSLAEADVSNNGWHCPPASKHGEQRWENGWSLTEVVRDYQILRLVILEYLDEALDRPMSGHEVMAIGLVLDEAIAASVARYGVHHHEATRRAQRERADRESQVEKRRLTREAELLRSAEKRTDEFLAVLGHELRNPLAPLLNSMHLLRLRGDDTTIREQAREMAERQVRQLTRLVEDLLDLARVRQGKIVLKLELIDLNVIVARAVETVRSALKERGQNLEVVLPPGTVPVQADSARLEQVLVNLLNNAAKFTDPGGNIWVTVERGVGETLVRVRDTGIGLAPESIGHIFDLYAQVEEARTHSQGGLGIGLSLVKAIVEQHGGSVKAASDGPGRGSEFVVRLPTPVEGLSPPESGEHQPASVTVHARRILVVEDNTDSARSLAVLLRLWGHQVETAPDGTTALAIAAAFKPDVALLDIGLPIMDGHELARRLCREVGLEGLVLIALTGFSQPANQSLSAESGFSHHLVKPVNPDDLKNLLALPDSAAKQAE